MGKSCSITRRKTRIYIDFYGTRNQPVHNFLEKALPRGGVVPAFKTNNIFLIRLANKLCNLGVPYFYSLLLGNWKKEMKNYEEIVLVANYLTINVVKIIQSKIPGKKVNIYYFNIIEKDISLEYWKEFNCKIWTFDRNDAEKYNLNLISNVSCYENFSLPPSIKKWDISFVGTDKGRISTIIELENIFKSLGLIMNFHVVSTGEQNTFNYPYKEAINYDELIKIMNQSNSVLDIVQDGQVGMTLRPIEAGFLKKKLITNSKEILNAFYYNSSNIFVIGHDDFESLPMFLNTEYKDVFDYNFFDIESWLERF